MKQIKLYMIHNSVHSIRDVFSYLKWENHFENYEFIWDEKNPDYVISTEHIYLFNECRKKFNELYSKKRIQIAVFSELYMPDFNLFDYSTGFYSEVNCADRYVQFLTPDKFYKSFIDVNSKPIENIEQANEELHNKKGFCNFLYSNPMAHPNRDAFFNKLSSYKKVDSLGKWLNNVGKTGTGFVGHANECIGIKSNYKFSIAFENATCKGYLTEKILTSLQAHTIPIYWGDPEVTKFINPKCFINCHDYKSFDDVVEKVREIDSDDEKWCKIVSQKWTTEQNIINLNDRNKKYYDFWQNIFNQDLCNGKRVAMGTAPDNYIKWFHGKSDTFKFTTRLINKVRRIIKH